MSSTVYRCDQSACSGTASGDCNGGSCSDDRHTDADLCPVGKCKGTAIVSVVDRVIQAIGKQVVARKGSACTDVGGGIRINESTDGRVIVTALQIVEPGFSGLTVAVLGFAEIL